VTIPQVEYACQGIYLTGNIKVPDLKKNFEIFLKLVSLPETEVSGGKTKITNQ
jgi:hypothetical protein